MARIQTAGYQLELMDDSSTVQISQSKTQKQEQM